MSEIVIIDPDLSFKPQMERLLGSNHSLMFFEDGAEGVDFITNNRSVALALVACELSDPLNAVEVVGRLRKLKHSVKIILTTGEFNMEQVPLATAWDGISLEEKPFRPEFAETISA